MLLGIDLLIFTIDCVNAIPTVTQLVWNKHCERTTFKYFLSFQELKISVKKILLKLLKMAANLDNRVGVESNRIERISN